MIGDGFRLLLVLPLAELLVRVRQGEIVNTRGWRDGTLLASTGISFSV